MGSYEQRKLAGISRLAAKGDRGKLEGKYMPNLKNSIEALNLRLTPGLLVILSAMIITVLFSTGQVSAQTPPLDTTPPVVTAPADIIIESAEGAGSSW